MVFHLYRKQYEISAARIDVEASTLILGVHSVCPTEVGSRLSLHMVDNLVLDVSIDFSNVVR